MLQYFLQACCTPDHETSFFADQRCARRHYKLSINYIKLPILHSKSGQPLKASERVLAQKNNTANYDIEIFFLPLKKCYIKGKAQNTATIQTTLQLNYKHN